jgi:hypothetical protein
MTSTQLLQQRADDAEEKVKVRARSAACALAGRNVLRPNPDCLYVLLYVHNYVLMCVCAGAAAVLP